MILKLAFILPIVKDLKSDIKEVEPQDLWNFLKVLLFFPNN